MNENLIILKEKEDLLEYLKNDILLLYFFSYNCNACIYYKPIIESATNELSKINENKRKKFKTLMIEVKNPKFKSIVDFFGFKFFPSVFVIKENKVVWEKVGCTYLSQKDLINFIENSPNTGKELKIF